MAMRAGLAMMAALGLGGAAVAQDRYNGYEMPPYQVEQQVGGAELRSYGPHLLAVVTVQGEQRQALNAGFRLLAGYIFGGNAGGQEVAMTVPVSQVPGDSMATTTPTGQDGQWTVSFMMPREWTLDRLPAPRDASVRFEQVPGERRLVLQFSGTTSTTRLDDQTATLRAIAADAGITLRGEPLFAFYDDPFTLPWNRRNEVAFRVE